MSDIRVAVDWRCGGREREREGGRERGERGARNAFLRSSEAYMMLTLSSFHLRQGCVTDAQFIPKLLASSKSTPSTQPSDDLIPVRFYILRQTCLPAQVQLRQTNTRPINCFSLCVKEYVTYTHTLTSAHCLLLCRAHVTHTPAFVSPLSPHPFPSTPPLPHPSFPLPMMKQIHTRTRLATQKH